MDSPWGRNLVEVRERRPRRWQLEGECNHAVVADVNILCETANIERLRQGPFTSRYHLVSPTQNLTSLHFTITDRGVFSILTPTPHHTRLPHILIP